MEVSEMGSNIYDPRNGGVIDISSEHGPEESPEYDPGPYYDMDDDNDAPTWPVVWPIPLVSLMATLVLSFLRLPTAYIVYVDLCRLANWLSHDTTIRSKENMTNKDEFSAATNIVVPIENPESSRSIVDIQNDEKMAHMQQELNILREELHQVPDLAKLSATTFATFKTPIYFPKVDLPSVDLPNQPELTQHSPTHGRVPPSSPTAVRTVSDLSNRDPTIPTMQQYLGYMSLRMRHMFHPIYACWSSYLHYACCGYKPPKFYMFDGKGDPYAHLRTYYDKLVCVGRNEKPTRVQPPLDESEISKYFIRAQEGIYFDKKMSMMGQKFAQLVKMGDFIEEVVTYQPGGPSHRYPNNPQIVLHTSYVLVYNTQPHYNPPRAPAYQIPPRPYVPVQATIHQNRPHMHRDHRLRTEGVLQPVKGKLPNPIPRNFDGSKRCAYHSRVQRHDIEDCYGLKNQIESLIKRGVIKCTPALPNVNNNPLPNHDNLDVNMVTLEDKYWSPDYPNIDENCSDHFKLLESLSTTPKQSLGTIEQSPKYQIVKCIKNGCVKNVEVWYQPKSGLGPKFNGIVKPMQPKHQRGTNGLRYEPTLGRFHQGASDTIFVPEQALIPDQAGVDKIIEGIGNLFVAMVGEKEEISLSKLTIHDAEPGEIL
ncbi:hypothetical protein H5410_002133 [Solanum commersonii]|uniref:Uncharacterized protein n=1 Tax=Solanum commersonii TaxID=4109 RepID=A0A9J6B146_SOLCO|nr:hypothetical protein H5410_002133 [Solanum commersonii]